MSQDNWIAVESKIWKPEKVGDTIEGILVLKKEKGGRYNHAAYYIESKNQT